MRIYLALSFALLLLAAPAVAQEGIPATAPVDTPVEATAAPIPEPAASAKMEDMHIVVLRTIDKLSARTHTFDIPVDKTVKFGRSLFIKVRACRKASPLEKPEDAAFLQIWERRPSEQSANWIFSGWMFATNPSISVMEHPVYDVWVIECKNNSTSSKSEEFSSEKAPEQAPEEETESLKEETDVPADEDEEEAVEETPPPTVTQDPPTGGPPPAEEQRPASPMPPIEQLPPSFEGGEGGTAPNTGD